jgi:hypothetical protein
MITNKFARIAGVAMVGAAFSMTANAVTTAYSTDDLFIGFTQAGNSKDYLVDIGQASNFTGQSAGTTVTLSLGNISADLVTVFGSGWATDSSVSWGVVGTTRLSTVGSDAPHTVYASKSGDSSVITPWNDAASLATPDARIATMASAYNNKASTANSSVGLIQNNVATASNNAFASFQPGGANATGASANVSFSYFNPTILASNAGGIDATTLGLFRLVSGDNNPGTAVGNFSISNGGSVSFVTAVPEPASISLGLVGATLLMVRRRRI